MSVPTATMSCCRAAAASLVSGRPLLAGSELQGHLHWGVEPSDRHLPTAPPPTRVWPLLPRSPLFYIPRTVWLHVCPSVPSISAPSTETSESIRQSPRLLGKGATALTGSGSPSARAPRASQRKQRMLLRTRGQGGGGGMDR